MKTKGRITVKNAHELGKDHEGKTMFMGTYKHPRRIEMEGVITVKKNEDTWIMNVAGLDELAGDYEVILT
jgi:hypothetical protein